MKTSVALVFALVVAGVMAAPAPQNQFPWEDPSPVDSSNSETTTPAPSGDVLTILPAGCRCQAVEQYNPVCGSDGRTYASLQKLRCFAACGTNVTYVRLGVCSRRQDVPT